VRVRVRVRVRVCVRVCVRMHVCVLARMRCVRGGRRLRVADTALRVQVLGFRVYRTAYTTPTPTRTHTLIHYVWILT
jgi:hypothetical protein